MNSIPLKTLIVIQSVLFAMALNIVYSNPTPTEFYVATDGNDLDDGTAEDPWRTIQKAANEATPGSTVYVKEGVYYEKIAINVEGNENDGSITFTNYENDEVVISGEGVTNNPASYSDDIVYIEDKSYLRIVGFEIRDIDAVEGSGIRFWGTGKKLEISNNKIHNIKGGGLTGGAMGITIYGSNDNSPISELLIEGNEIYDCEPAHSEALTLNGNVKNFEVLNNVIHDVNNIGIDFIGGESWISSKYTRNGVCSGNIVYHARSSYGDGFAAGIYVDGGKNIIIENNEVYECDLGIEVGAENAGVTTRNITVRNNFIHDNDKAGLVVGGYSSYVGRVKDSSFTNNVLVHNDTLSYWFGEIWVQFASDNVFMRNYLHPTQQNVILASWGGSVNNVFDFDYICTDYGIENAVFVLNSAVYYGLSSFQENTGMELNAGVCNPNNN